MAPSAAPPATPVSGDAVSPFLTTPTATSPGAPSTTYKAEMTDSQVQHWRQQRLQENIKVEVPSTTNTATQSTSVPSSSFSSASASDSAYRPAQQQQQYQNLDIHAQIQLELQRKTQLQALHRRQGSAFGAGPPSPQPSWNHSHSPTTHAATSPISVHSPYPTHASALHTTASAFNPTPVELQSSLTDATPVKTDSQESSLTTLDLAPAVTFGVNAKVSHPYGSTQEPQRHVIGQQSQSPYPSAIEQQSSLTEMDATTDLSDRSSGPYQGSGPRPVLSGHAGNTRPASFQRVDPPSAYPSAIEQQSSLTEIDNLPHPIEAQSSLTEIDNLPHPIEEQSALTELDNLPHPLQEQSALTEIDDLPHPLEQQSALTEIDNLPHALEEQSALTEIDNLPHGLSEQSALTALDDEHEPRSRHKNNADTGSTGMGDNAPASIVTDDPSPMIKHLDKPPEAALSVSAPSIEAIAQAAPSSFSMSNWTMPSDFTDPAAYEDSLVLEDNDQFSSPSGSLHERSSAMMHIDTALNESDRRARFMARTESTGVLIPLTPNTGASSPAPSSPLWKPLSASSSLSRKANGSTSTSPPVPAPKPASLMAAKTNHPQAGSAGTAPTLSEEIHLPPVSERPVLLPLQDELDLEDSDMEEEDGHDLAKANDGVSAFIRELQSSISLSRSGSGSNSLAESIRHKDLSEFKRTDSTSSGTSGHASEPTIKKQEPTSVETANVTVLESIQLDGQHNGELQQLEATQFEWTFTESEQTTYERIFGLWERPAEECVSYLYKIWQLLNPEEKPVLSRTEFIAGLHLVNCKAIGYELPEELPDELMVSAAAVGRIIIPPRPVQGPSTLLPNHQDHVMEATSTSTKQQSRLPSSVPAIREELSNQSASAESSNINGYNASSLSYNVVATLPTASYVEQQKLGESDIYVAYPFQQPQPQPYQHDQYPHPQYSSIPPAVPMPMPIPMPTPYLYQHTPSSSSFKEISPPVPAPRPALSSGSNSNANLAEMIPTPSKPGPHALHDVSSDAPVFLSMEDELLLSDRGTSRSMAGIAAKTASANQTGSVYDSCDTTPSVQPSTPALADTIACNRHSVDNLELYLSPPDAWDHDAAPPELDVEGSYIKYRSDFKNDMTVSASVTANHPINPKCGIFYFEITIDQFKEVKGSAISIGIASKSLRKNCQVGWDLNSWGYHSDDGFLYFGNGKQNIKYAYEYKENDVVGCGINFVDRAVFFTQNGDMLGVAFRFIKDTIPLYPAIGLSHAGTEINANFGDQTFLFNIVDYKKMVMSKRVQSQPLITWSNGARNNKVFQVLPDGLSVIANGNDAGCIRGPKVSPRDKDVFYFEITILYMPATELGTIMIGICGKDQSMTDILGWNENSYGYSGECGDFMSISSNRSSLNARSQSGKMKARARGPPFRAGSVVGCGVDFASRELFFTLNGDCLGQAFSEVDVLDCFPCVSVVDGGGGVGGPLSLLREQPGTSSSALATTSYRSQQAANRGPGSSDDRIGFEFKANFGQYPFLFDLPAFEASEGQ
ncbi:hypothetical protein EDD11_006174 [Mortierella claussenii]|nr:hypothetical protein EDD11_006174 [Mortierella claussenii]